MAEKEKALPEDQRIDFVTIVVQNHLHFDVAKTFLQAGFNVICDKPVTYDLAQARELRKIINKTKKVFALTHNYAGYPMVKLAREMVKKGELGESLKWFASILRVMQSLPLLEKRKQLLIGGPILKLQAFQIVWEISVLMQKAMVHYITGLEIDKLCADLSVNIPGRKLDDDE